MDRRVFTLMAVLLGTATGVAYFLLRVWHFATNHAGVV